MNVSSIEEKNKQQDIRDMGLIMIRLIELQTSLNDPKSLKLQNFDDSNSNLVKAQQFLNRTNDTPSEDLEKVINFKWRFIISIF